MAIYICLLGNNIYGIF